MMVCRGDIWLTNFNPVKKNNAIEKIRPALIFQNDELNSAGYPTTIVLPLTTSLVDNAEPLRFRVNARGTLQKDSDILIAQIRSIDNGRFIEKLTTLSNDELQKIKSLLDEILT